MTTPVKSYDDTMRSRSSEPYANDGALATVRGYKTKVDI